MKFDSPIKTPTELVPHLKPRAGRAHFGPTLGGAEHMTTVQMLRSKGGSVLEFYGGFAVPAGTPPVVIEGYYKTLAEVGKNANLVDRLAVQLTAAEVAPGVELQKLLVADLAQWTPIAAELNLTVN